MVQRSPAVITYKNRITSFIEAALLLLKDLLYRYQIVSEQQIANQQIESDKDLKQREKC